MILLPIGRDESEIRRHAWVCYTIIALNVIFFAALIGATSKSDQQSETGWRNAVVWLAEHPYLEIPPRLEESLDPRLLEQIKTAGRQSRLSHLVPPAWEVEREQARLDALMTELEALLQSSPYVRWGYVPAQPSLRSMLTSLFIHGGLFHLLGNLLFLFVSGPFVEDVYGRPLFTFLYFSGGAVATTAHAAHFPASEIPLVGASGAIAAVMGAYLVRFHRSRVRFIFIPFLLLPHWSFRFFLPAFVVLPLWFFEQLISANSRSAATDVAFWAHVGGFVWGFGLAWLIRLLGIEERYINPAIEAKTIWRQKDELVRASAARERGDLDAAQRELALLLRKEPDDIDARRIALDVAIDREAWDEAGAHATRLLERYLSLGEPDLAQELINEAEHLIGRRLPERFLLRAASWSEKQGDSHRAIDLYRQAAQRGGDSPAAVRSMMQVGRLLVRNHDHAGAERALLDARNHPACPEEWKKTVDSELSLLKS